MKPEEAMELLDTDISNIGIDRKGYAKGVSYVDWGRMVITAKAALEKQIPKEPKKLTYQPLLHAGWKWECPCCGLAVGENKYHDEVTDKDKYCCSCGQALLWR